MQFVTAITGLSREQREARAFDEVTGGNVPEFMRGLKAVSVTESIAGQSHTAVYHVIPDYLAVGSDADYFLCPMTPILGQQIADALECNLPTRKMVNDISDDAEVRLASAPFSPATYDIMALSTWVLSNNRVREQRNEQIAAFPLGALVDGDRKDIIVTPQLHDGSRPPPPRVAIYGWHQLNGQPIQQLSLVHEETYADYSHGVRLVQSAMLVDGNATTVQAVIADPNLAALLSDEGAFDRPRYDVPGPPEDFPYVDAFPPGGRELASWIDRFTGKNGVIPFSPASPGGEGSVLRVWDQAGGINTARVGRVTDTDYAVECDVYCELRAGIASDGFERVGIFARDDGNGMFEGANLAGTIRGSNYALTWDSHDGRVQCLKTVSGAATDLLASPRFEASTAWRRMRIEALGDLITFSLNDAVLVSVRDSAHAAGQFGIGYHDYFAANANIAGTRADNFNARTGGPTDASAGVALR